MILYLPSECTLKNGNVTWIEAVLSQMDIVSAIEKYFFHSISPWGDIDLASTAIASKDEESLVLNPPSENDTSTYFHEEYDIQHDLMQKKSI